MGKRYTRLSESEKRTVYCVLETLLTKPYEELNTTFGSLTIEEMSKLHHKLRYEDYCKEHGKKLEELDEYDYEREYNERYYISESDCVPEW